jgi:hypothetical protein
MIPEEGPMKYRLAIAAITAVTVLASCFAASPRSAAATVTRAEPTLGLSTGLFAQGSGFGKVRPKEVFNGGDPTGLVSSISWRSWGQGQAVGTGRSVYVAPNRAVAQGTVQPVRIVAFDLGTCNGHYMYAAVEWYFPQHKQAFDSRQFEDVCIGAYYPLQTGAFQDGAHGYTVTLNGTPGALRGSVSHGKQVVFSFHGRAGINGGLTLVSTGPFEAGHTFTGSWQTLAVQLNNCRAYLKAAPSCTFY